MQAAHPQSKPLFGVKRIDLSNNAVESLKWLAVFLMLGDHANKFLFGGQLPFLFEAGRIAMPLFAIVLGFNLARATVDARVRVTMMKRLACFGMLAFAPFVALNARAGAVAGHWWPLNILFALLAIVTIVHALQLTTAAGNWAAGAIFVVSGALVEFWWPAVGLGVAAWLYFAGSRWSWMALPLGALALLGIGAINGNQWAWAALPIVVGASRLPMKRKMPRARLFFYSFYPAHLALLWLASSSS
jgi:hypothetical protein